MSSSRNRWIGQAARGCMGALAAAALLAGSGCEDGHTDANYFFQRPRPDPVGPDLEGAWTGHFYITDHTDGYRKAEQAMTATVLQDGAEITMTTDLAQGRWRSFSGSIDVTGHLHVRDASGQTWTSYFGASQPNRLKIADFVEDPNEPGHDDGLYVIALER
jgi:hypothetical protein